MELPFVNSPFYPSTSTQKHNRAFSFSFSFSFNGYKLKKGSSLIASVSGQTTTQTTYNSELENKKNNLLFAVQETQRGLLTSSDQRSHIEEALVNVEAYNNINKPLPIDLSKLDGTWRLQYTSAPDVLILLQSPSTLPFFQIGQIFQKFECSDGFNQGIVRNVVRWSIPSLLEEHEGATLVVSAKFSLVSTRNIYLQFEEISVQNLKISEELQALIAPAFLPRSFLSLQMLQFIRGFKAQVPVRNSGRSGGVGGLYYLSYVDGNMLLGRAVGGGGVFVFTRAQPLHLEC